MGLMDNIGKLITEHGSAGILKERLELLRDQMELVVKENEENKTLRHELESQAATDEFVRHRGVLFLRLPDGAIQDEVYCPRTNEVACKHTSVFVWIM